MKREEIEKVFRNLALSQGYYGRLLRQINEASGEQREEFWTELEAQNFKGPVDVVMFMEEC